MHDASRIPRRRCRESVQCPVSRKREAHVQIYESRGWLAQIRRQSFNFWQHKSLRKKQGKMKSNNDVVPYRRNRVHDNVFLDSKSKMQKWVEVIKNRTKWRLTNLAQSVPHYWHPRGIRLIFNGIFCSSHCAAIMEK